MKSDVIVIGNGMAGLVAALLCADQGKKVVVISYGAGTFSLNSGLIDVMGYDDTGNLVKNPMQGIIRVGENHPYKKIGIPAIQDAIYYIKEILEQENFSYIGELNTQQWAITSLGTLKPTCLLPESMNAEGCFKAQEIVIVGIKGLKDFYAEIVTENLKKELGDKRYTPITLDLEISEGRDLTTRDIANYIDTEAGYNKLLSKLKSYSSLGRAIIVPQILGTKGNTVFKKLSQELKSVVVETISVPPSVNGGRLRGALLSALHRRNIYVVENAKAREAIFEGKLVKGIRAGGEARLQTYYADKFILATGGFYGGGLSMYSMGSPIEEVFGLDVEAECLEDKWANKQLFSEEKQVFAMAGIKVDASMRGTKNGEQIENVYVVGRNLSGYDFCFEHSGNGVAISSAYKAAKI